MANFSRNNSQKKTWITPEKTELSGKKTEAGSDFRYSEGYTYRFTVRGSTITVYGSFSS